MARSDDIVRRLDSIAAAIATQGDLLAQIVARLDRSEAAPPSLPRFLVIKQAAYRAGVSHDTITRWCKRYNFAILHGE
jgi:hypothetical protein